MDLELTIKKLDENPKVSQLSIFKDIGGEQYASVQFLDKFARMHDILVDIEHLYLLCYPISMSGGRKGKYYVRLKMPEGSLYLHRVITEPPAGYVAHHIYENFTCDNRKSSLQVVTREEHSRFHRQLVKGNATQP